MVLQGESGLRNTAHAPPQAVAQDRASGAPRTGASLSRLRDEQREVILLSGSVARGLEAEAAGGHDGAGPGGSVRRAARGRGRRLPGG